MFPPLATAPAVQVPQGVLGSAKIKVFDLSYNYPGATATEFTSVSPSPNGNFIIGGLAVFGAAPAGNRGLVMAVSPSGTVLWTRLIIGNAGATGVKVDRVRALGDNSVVATCTGQTLAAARFQGTTGNVIWSVRRPRPGELSIIGEDGACYLGTDQITQQVPFTTTISPQEITTGFNLIRQIGISRVKIDASVKEYVYELQEQEAVNINLNANPIQATVRYRRINPIAKIALWGSDAFLMSTYREEYQSRTVAPTANLFMHYNMMNAAGDVTSGRGAGTSAAGDIEAQQLGVNSQGNPGIKVFRSVPSYLDSYFGHDRFTNSTGGLPYIPLSDRRVAVGGFFHQTFESRGLPTRWSDSKVSSNDLLMYTVYGQAVDRDQLTVSTIDKDVAMLSVGRIREADGITLDYDGIPDTTDTTFVHSALSKSQNGRLAVVGGVVPPGLTKRGRLVLIDQPPILRSDSISTAMNTPIGGNILAGDIHAVGSAFSIHTAPAHGTLTGPNASGDYTYTPTTGYSGSDSFKYRVTKSGFAPRIATVNITVVP